METSEQRLRRLNKKARDLPLLPGVYVMRDRAGHIIYIGKARQLKNRVGQYFTGLSRHAPKVLRMVMNVEDFEYIVCDSELEALMLECSMIKQHRPKYNILLKDDKGYHYIRTTGGEWPTVRAVMQKTDDGAEYLGPYYSFYVARETVDEACKIFGLQSCGKQFPRDIGKERPCLNHYIGACMAPCSGRVKSEDYREAFRQAMDFIKGGSAASLRKLKEEMQKASDRLEFERAARLRDRIRAIERSGQKQKVVSVKGGDQDVIGAAAGEGRICFEVFMFRDGRLCDRSEYVTEPLGDEAETASEFIKSFYSETKEIPRRIVCGAELPDGDVISAWLTEKTGHRVKIITPRAGEPKKLVEMCEKNAAEHLATVMGRTNSRIAALDELARLLGLKNPPEYIEAYDISHTGGDENVAGMVVFKNGEPLRRAYRTFKIKGFSGQNDAGSMREVLTRRLEEYKNAADGEEGFGRLPDLILLDGGRQQLSAVLPVLDEYGVDVPVFGMVKDGRHKTDAITSSGGTIAIKSNRRAYTLVFKIQEEVHRFAIGYHHRRRGKTGLQSRLLEIDGIGPAKAKALYTRFRTIAAITEADEGSLAATEKITAADAKKIYSFFHK